MLKTQRRSDVKTLESHFLTPANPEGSVTDPSLSLGLKRKTIATAGLMHICHARRIGGPDGHDTVAGASTNVCGCPCCYLYRSETQTRKYLQKDSEPFFVQSQSGQLYKQMGLNVSRFWYLNFISSKKTKENLIVLQEKKQEMC